MTPPQFTGPEDPRGERRCHCHCRLDSSNVTEEEAEAACLSLEDSLLARDCIHNILATQDLDMLGAF